MPWDTIRLHDKKYILISFGNSKKKRETIKQYRNQNGSTTDDFLLCKQILYFEYMALTLHIESVFQQSNCP